VVNDIELKFKVHEKIGFRPVKGQAVVYLSKRKAHTEQLYIHFKLPVGFRNGITSALKLITFYTFNKYE
jgi:hypothetical protein